MQAVHTTLMASHKFFTASDKHRMITHSRGRACTCVYAQRLKRFITRNFSSQLNRVVKTEPVQNRNRFRRIRYFKWTSLQIYFASDFFNLFLSFSFDLTFSHDSAARLWKSFRRPNYAIAMKFVQLGIKNCPKLLNTLVPRLICLKRRSCSKLIRTILFDRTDDDFQGMQTPL